MTLRDDCISLILKHEGGAIITNDARDSGGLTRYGISQKAYPALDIANLTESQAREIYARDYWTACKCQELPPALALCVFDAAVNQGPVYARRTLQQVLRVPVDGKIGPVTLNKAAIDPAGAVTAYQSARALTYTKTKGFDVYGGGWLSRVISTAIAAAKLL